MAATNYFQKTADVIGLTKKIRLAVTQQNVIHLSQGMPVTYSLTIAREFGQQHSNVVESLCRLIEDGTISHREFKKLDFMDKNGMKLRMIELTERGTLIAMPFIGGKTQRQGQVRLVDAFLAMHDDLAKQSAFWQASRKTVSASFNAMMDALQATRSEMGKLTQKHHYMNEAKMINFVAFGVSGSVDKTLLSSADLELVEKIEAKNAFLIARGRNYHERKAELELYRASTLKIREVSAHSRRAMQN